MNVGETDLFRKQRFSIRKFSVGAASVCVGLF
ncbi:TPA: YSIRK-type signal peptide-containing protein [Streptococcus suis]